jgi:uncharacterized protein (TIGR00369 family)
MTASGTKHHTHLKRSELQKLILACPFHRFLGLELIAADEEEGTITLGVTAREEFSRSDDLVELHGGIIASLIDIAGDYAVAMKVGRGVPTINLRVDYLRPGRGRKAFAKAKAIRCGRTIATVDIEVTDENGTLFAIGRGTYSSAISA